MWRGYRGGETTSIRLANLADSSIVATNTRDNSNDSNPMWIGETIYFLSDRNGPVTIFSYDVKSHQVKQLLKADGLDVTSASASSDAIVYVRLGSIHLLDLKSGDDRVLDIRPVADFPDLRPHFEKIDPSQITYADLSPSGESAVFAARGDILTVSRIGEIRNLTHTTNVVERDPAWSPDGKSIAYFSDELGHYALYVSDPNGRVEVQKINLEVPRAYYYGPTWSPDSKKIAFTDQQLNYWYVDLKTKKLLRVDTDLYTDPGNVRKMVWSPDSRWLAYTKQLPNHLHGVFVYSLEQARSSQITDGRTDALHVAFDKGGKYLYLTASTDLGLGNTSWLDMSALPHVVTRGVYMVLLNKDLTSPFASAGGQRKASDDIGRSHGINSAEINLDDISTRMVPLPVPRRNYYDLIAGNPGTIFLVEGPQVETYPASGYGDGDETTADVYRFDLETRNREQILQNITVFTRDEAYVPSFHPSFDNEKLLYAKKNQWFIATMRKPGAANLLNVEKMEVYVDPRAEWAHMFEQVWRDEFSFFYDPNLYGLDVATIKKRYQRYLKGITNRDDLNYLFNEMLGNLGVSHLGFYPPGLDAKGITTGLLGADFAVEDGRYRFAYVYGADPWDPAVRAPLTQPGTRVYAGDYLLAVNGRSVTPTADVYSYFEEMAGKPVVLTVSSTPDASDVREITVVPIADEAPLRSYAWTENNRHKVDQLSGGRVAYVYLPDTYQHGYESFNREYYSQVGKDGAVIDARYNVGGNIPDYIIDSLSRPLRNYWHMRYGEDIAEPQEAIFGPKVLIVNEMTGSGGDDLSWLFRHAHIGLLVGKRTWGGLVGTYGVPDDIMDGSTASTPNLAFYNPDGTWDIENHGVTPDIEAEDDPQGIREGHDPQLEMAVKIVLDQLAKTPPPHTPPHPAYPINGQPTQ